MSRDTLDQNGTVDAETVTTLLERVDALEEANEQLRAENESLREEIRSEKPAEAGSEAVEQRLATLEALVGEIAPRALPTGGAGLPSDTPGIQADGGSATYKILGQFDESNGGIGVLGCNTASSGATTGVKGEVESGDDDAAGVRGVATDDSSGAAADGVVGETSGTGVDGGLNTSNEFAIGVSGRATNTSAVKSYGVYGENGSINDGTAGVFGFASGGSGTNYGVRGQTTSDDTGAAGVFGESGSGETYGVHGTTSTDEIGGAGVYGESTNSSSFAPAVRAESEDGVAVKALHRSGEKALDASGWIRISKVGGLAYRSSNQSIPNDDRTTIKFDRTEQAHFSGFNKSTGVYTVPHPGAYHVDFGVDWAGTGFGNGDTLTYALELNGDVSDGLEANTGAPGTAPAHSFSKTLYNLNGGETIRLQVTQKTGESQDIVGTDNSSSTYLGIHKVG